MYLFIYFYKKKNDPHFVTLKGVTLSLIPAALCGSTFYLSLLAKPQGKKGAILGCF